MTMLAFGHFYMDTNNVAIMSIDVVTITTYPLINLWAGSEDMPHHQTKMHEPTKQLLGRLGIFVKQMKK